MDWIEGEPIRLFCPRLADVFVGREALELTSKVVGRDEVGEVDAQLLMGLVVVTADRRFLEGAVHPFDLSICPGMLGPGQAVIDIVLRAAALITAEPSDRGARNSPEAGPPLLGDAPGSAVQFLGGLGNIPAAPATGLCACSALPPASARLSVRRSARHRPT